MRQSGASDGRGADPLRTYARKRSFQATPEPPPGTAPRHDGPLLFVVQQHAARRLHWDFRLEAGGVLLSWAVPNGPSLVTGEKRLAVRTEDHPFDYASFEGVIPKGQYGAGEVIVWDTGVYSPDEHGEYAFDDREGAERRIAQGLARGKLSIFLRGHKLKGSFALVRMKEADKKEADNWLLLKHGDRFSRAEPPVTDATHSVLTDVTLEDLTRPGRDVSRIEARRLTPSGKRSPLPRGMAPMLATPESEPFDRPGWRYEPKLDGYRALAVIKDGEARLHSRRGGLDLNKPFPDILEALRAQAIESMILDGELVAFDAQGRPSFHALQNTVPGPRPGGRHADPGSPAATCVLFCFDLLYFAGIDLRERPYEDRRRYLEQCLLPSAQLQLVHVEDDGLALYAAALEAGFEGMVAKRRDSKYEAGRRSRQWVKVKRVDTSEFVVGGYTRGKGWRASQFGSLLLGEPAGRKKLEYVGRVGSGFDDMRLAELKRRLEPLKTATMPFLERPDEVQGATWVKPETVVEVRYAEVTPLGLLRAPVFVRVRDDKPVEATGAAVESASADESRGRARRMTDESGRRAIRTSERSSRAREPKAKQTGHAPDDIAAVVAQLDGKAARMSLEVQGETIALTNLDKVLWPEDRELDQRAYTKRDFIGYLARVSPYMLPHLADRPLTMIRMPDGIHGERFFQKHWEHKLPRFVERVEVFSESKSEQHEYLLCNNLVTLLWLGQIGTLEFHVWHSRANPAPELAEAALDYASSLEALEASVLNYPDYVVFDLDPYIYSGKEKKGAEPELNDVAFERGKEVAFWLRELMRSMALEPIVKTSGKTGLHVYLPIVRTIDFDAARAVCEAIGRHLMQQHPDAITMEWSTRKRTGKIFFDHNMNARAKTLNVAYSPRGVAGTPVSMPLTWEELERAHPLDFRMDNVIERLQRSGDRWRDALSAKQDLTRSLAGPTVAGRKSDGRPGRRSGSGRKA
ncbi:MAG: ATP-dependent DNA ligase [Betaproteobacteria bacterium]|nr:ATP-dependent DNA ligase [Betaproteobacteria bacterium]